MKIEFAKIKLKTILKLLDGYIGIGIGENKLNIYVENLTYKIVSFMCESYPNGTFESYDFQFIVTGKLSALQNLQDKSRESIKHSKIKAK